MTDHLQWIAEHFEGCRKNGDGYIAQCPCHDDSTPSLTIKTGTDGKTLIGCFAGCNPGEIIEAVGLRWGDLFSPFEYKDARGRLVKRAVRKPGKKFHQERYEDGKWVKGGGPAMLYRLPEFLSAPLDAFVFIMEGEAKVDLARMHGLVATCSDGGAGKWKDEFARYFKDRRVVILPDNDNPGRVHAELVAKSLWKVAASVRVVILPGLPEKGDYNDWMDAGHTTRELFEIVTATPPYEPINRVRPIPIREFIKQNPEEPPVLVEGIIRLGDVLNVVAAPKIGKSWFAYELAMSIATGRKWLKQFQCTKGRVLLVDNELHPGTLAFRIPEVAAALGIPLKAIEAQLDIVALRGRLLSLEQIEEHVVEYLDRDQYAAVVLDAWYRTIPTGGAGENDNAAMTEAYNALDRLAAKMGAAWIPIHHSSKGWQNEKKITDVGAGAGSQSRAADTHLVLREHEKEDCIVLETAVRSFERPKKLVLRWDFPLWVPAPDLDPDQLRRPPQPTDTRREAQDQEGATRILAALQGSPMTRRALRTELNMRVDRVNRLISKLLQDGKVETDGDKLRRTENG